MSSEGPTRGDGDSADDQRERVESDAEPNREEFEQGDPDAPGEGIAEGGTPAEPNEPG